MTEPPPPSDARPLAEAAALRHAAHLLRSQAADMAEALVTVTAHDRDDVWQGAVADGFRARHDEVRRRLGSPWSGAVPGLVASAERMERRAAWLAGGAALPS